MPRIPPIAFKKAKQFPTEVNRSMRVMTKESFGPVVGIQKVPSDAKAVELMNDSVSGLTAAFFNLTLAIRSYNHLGFMINTYDPDAPTCCDTAVSRILNRGALHYTVGMRGFYLSPPCFCGCSGRYGCLQAVLF